MSGRFKTWKKRLQWKNDENSPSQKKNQKTKNTLHTVIQ